MRDMIVCPGCGWRGGIETLKQGACPLCGYENNLEPYRLLTLSEIMEADCDYNDVNLDLFLKSLIEIGLMRDPRSV